MLDREIFLMRRHLFLRKGEIAITMALSLLCMFSVLLAGCNKLLSAERVALDFAQGNVTVHATTINFEQEGTVVLRCASVVEIGNGIVVKASKSKDMKANFLIFVRPTEAGTSTDNIQIALVPITSKEYEYDMAQARFCTVTEASARAALNTYGIPFLDWQTGAVNGSEKFPCCE
jgi:hypothetical protein